MKDNLASTCIERIFNQSTQIERALEPFIEGRPYGNNSIYFWCKKQAFFRGKSRTEDGQEGQLRQNLKSDYKLI